ncbi:MAG: NUDIX hydrolase [Planctomycetota bacterium]
MPTEPSRPDIRVTESPREVSRRTLLSGRRVDFVEVTLNSDSGGEIVREVVKHPGAVTIVPVLPNGRLVMVRNHRFSVGQDLLEFPAGMLDAGEDPAACAARELREETGYDADEIVPLGAFFTTAGITDEIMHVFGATGLRHVGAEPEVDEWVTPEEATVEQLWGAAGESGFADGKSVAALLLAAKAGLIPLGPKRA